MEFIGKRISVKQKEKELSIVILSFKDKVKNIFLLGWCILWTIAGLAVLSQYFFETDPNNKTVIIVWMGFWAYFEFKVIKAYRWRTYGKEIIKIRKDLLLYKRDVSGKGKINEYQTDFIKNLRTIKKGENSFIETLNNSYWMTGSETLEFDYNGREIKFAFQLEEKDSEALLQLLKKKIG